MEKTKRKVCWIRVFKNISYIIAPFLLIILIISIISLLYSYQTDSIRKGETYFESLDFAERYMNSITRQMRRSDNVSEEIEYRETNDFQEVYYNYITDYYVKNGDITIYYDVLSDNSNFYYLIINQDANIAYTNVPNRIDTQTIEAIKSRIVNNQIYWNFENGKMDTSIEKLKENINEKSSIYLDYLDRKSIYRVYLYAR